MNSSWAVAVAGEIMGGCQSGTDSGVARSVMPKTLCTNYPTIETSDSKTGVVCRTVTGVPVRDEGTKSVKSSPHGGDGRHREAKIRSVSGVGWHRCDQGSAQGDGHF